MPSRQDQLHSHQYSLQRAVAALITHDPDPHRSPLRRAGTTALVGMLIAALAVGGAAVHGLLTGHSSVQVRDESAVFVEKGSGARYVYLGADARLHPVLNYTSGLLIANGSAPKVVGASRKRLASVPLGEPLGIPDAPDSLPLKGELRTGDWSVCTTSGSAGPTSTLLVGVPVTGGADAAGKALLVSDPTGRIFLVYGNTRSLIPPDRATASLRALGWNARQPWPVAAAFLNAIPLGPDLAAPAVPGSGAPSGLDGYRVGQLLTDGRQWSVALADGAAAVTDVQARLLRARPGSPAPRALGDTFNHLPPSRTRLSDAGRLPAEVPELATPTERVCMTVPVDRDTGAGVRVDPAVPAGTPVVGAAAAPGGVQADFVHVARGTGALVVSAASPSTPADHGTVSVVTDTGRRFPIASRDVLGRLGYRDVAPRPVPAQVVALLPQGPSLDPAQARMPAPRPGA